MEYLPGIISVFMWIGSMIGTIFNSLTIARMGQLLSLAVLTSVCVGLYRLHTNKNNPFDLSDLFLDPKTKRIDGAKTRVNLAFFLTSWIMIYTTLNDHLVEWLFLAYLTAWVADRKFSRESLTDLVVKPQIPVLTQTQTTTLDVSEN